VVVLAVFAVALVYGIVHLRGSSSPSGPTTAPAAFTVQDATSACRAWSGIDPVIGQAVQADDPTALYHLETGGGPQGEYGPMMRWAQLAAARQQSVILATDLINLQTEISSAASGTESLSDLPVPTKAIADECRYPDPGDAGSGS
jgi:hypothetical protein